MRRKGERIDWALKTPLPPLKRSGVWFGLGRLHHPIAAEHATSMKHQEIRYRKFWRLGLSQDWNSCSEDGHAYVPSVEATMVELGVVDGHGDVHHRGTTELFAMSAQSLCAVVDHVYDQLVKF